MTVYVGKAMFPWRGKKWAHLTADSLEELHCFAAQKLGLKRSYFQNPKTMKVSHPHYDITESKRTMAIQKGAVSISPRGEVERLKSYRIKAYFEKIYQSREVA
jgi:hypothetical protein